MNWGTAYYYWLQQYVSHPYLVTGLVCLIGLVISALMVAHYLDTDKDNIISRCFVMIFVFGFFGFYTFCVALVNQLQNTNVQEAQIVKVNKSKYHDTINKLNQQTAELDYVKRKIQLTTDDDKLKALTTQKVALQQSILSLTQQAMRAAGKVNQALPDGPDEVWEDRSSGDF